MGYPAGEGKGPVYVLSREKRIAVLRALVEGNSERAVERMTDVNARTIARLAVEFGTGAARLHDQLARDLTCTDIECDEIWSYVGKKQARVTPEDGPEVGEAYTFVGIDRASRFVISFHVGKRDAESTATFMADLRSRLVMMPVMSTDGFAAYPAAVGAEFGPGVDFGTMTKNYHSAGRRDGDHRYAPVRGVDFITKRTVFGAPDMASISTAHVERNNLTMRHHIGRIRRLCLAFSKRLDRHCHAVSLGYVWYNVGCVVKTLRMTPAMAVGATDTLYTIDMFHDAITDLAKVAVSKPEKKPLVHRTPEQTARALPDGRGFLRVVQGGAGSPAPQPGPATPPAAPSMPVVADDVTGQLDLLSWRPKATTSDKFVQLDLFGGPSTERP
jgi:IS1 family transposase